MFPPPHPQDFKSARCPPSLQDPGFSTATGSVWQTPFPLTSGTNSAWHVWRGCSVFEPRPRRDYSMQPGSPAPQTHVRWALSCGGCGCELKAGASPLPGAGGEAWHPVPPGPWRTGIGPQPGAHGDKEAGKGLATA